MATRTTTRTHLSVRSIIVLLAIALLSMAFRPAIAAAETPQPTTEAQVDDTTVRSVEDIMTGDSEDTEPSSTESELVPGLESNDAATSTFEFGEVRGVDVPRLASATEAPDRHRSPLASPRGGFSPVR